MGLGHDRARGGSRSNRGAGGAGSRCSESSGIHTGAGSSSALTDSGGILAVGVQDSHRRDTEVRTGGFEVGPAARVPESGGQVGR